MHVFVVVCGRWLSIFINIYRYNLTYENSQYKNCRYSMCVFGL